MIERFWVANESGTTHWYVVNTSPDGWRRVLAVVTSEAAADAVLRLYYNEEK